MRCTLDRIQLDIPEGFREDTLHVFRSKEKKEELTIEHLHEPAHRTPEAVVADRSGQARDVFGGDLEVEREESLRVADRPARVLHATLREVARVWLAAIDCGSSRFLELKYITDLSVDSAPSRWEHVLASVRIGRSKANEPVPPRYVRHVIGNAIVDVPSDLEWPSVYSFRQAALEMRVAVAISDLTGGGRRVDLPNEETDPESMDRIREREEERVEFDDGATILTRYVVEDEDDPDDSVGVARADLLLGDGLKVTVVGRGPASAGQEIGAHVRSIVQSVSAAR